jgi:DNA-binding NtrC family response regulator
VSATGTRHGRVLLIEDDPVLGGALRQRLTLEGFEVVLTADCASALAALRRQRPDFVLSDIRLPDGSGESLYRRALPLLANTPIVFATAFADLPQAVRLVRAGADDYLTKPIDVEALVDRIRATLAGTAAESAAESAAAATASSGVTRPAIGSGPQAWSAGMPAIEADLQRLASRRVPVLLRGETGVGKDVAARALHHRSAWQDQPFIAVNCGAIAADLAESRFFGHERGAFTGATTAHAGFFEQAGQGTLFLDEVGELDARLQTALLRVLQDGSFRRVGGQQDLQFQGRIVAATNADLPQRIREGSFREDLYYRLAVVELAVPALRERRDEIGPLATRFLAEAHARDGDGPHRFADDALDALRAHDWPGNVRELRNRIERAAALTDGDEIAADDLFPERRLDDGQTAVDSLADARDLAEAEQIRRALEASGGRLAEAAERLGISRTTLWKRRRKYGA